jgi:protein-S-isoprenylcysteine O-methyltransferase Ste14
VIARAATLFVFAAGWLVIFRYRSEQMSMKLAAATAAERRWIPLTTAVVSLHVSLAELLITLPLFGPAPAPAVNEMRRWLAGIVVYLAGLALWFWTRRVLGPLDRYVDTVSPPPRLLVDGPFALVRHPLMLATLLCALGPAVATNAVLTWSTFAASAFCIAKRCMQDEETLWSAFGDTYAAYAARTRRIVPFVW